MTTTTQEFTGQIYRYFTISNSPKKYTSYEKAVDACNGYQKYIDKIVEKIGFSSNPQTLKKYELINLNESEVKMKVTKLFIGLNDKDTRIQEVTDEQAIKILNECLLVNKIEGATLYTGYGLYTHNDNTVVNEKTLILELLFCTDEQIVNLCESLKIKLNQECIALQEVQLSKCELI